MRHEAMSTWLRDRMAAREIRTSRQLIDRMLVEAKCSVHENMVSRWLTGKGRPQGHRLEALLDVLGVVKEDERRAVRELAYFPPAAESSNRSALDEDETPTEHAENRP